MEVRKLKGFAFNNENRRKAKTRTHKNKENNWIIPTEVKPYELAIEMIN